MGKWISPPPTKCDICGTPRGAADFVDGRTKVGPWAIMCLKCHGTEGVGLGLGKGQKYNGFTLEKVEG